MQIPFVGPAYRSRSLTMSAQRCVNLYLETDEGKGGKTPAMLVGTPGLRQWSFLFRGGGNVRAVFPLSNGFLLAVCGNAVFYVNASGVAAYIGDIASTSGPVSIDENGIVAALADGNARYAVDITTWALSTLDGGAADRVAFIDGYFIFNRPNTQQFDVSDLYSTTIPSTSFAAAEGSPDRLISLIADHRELWLFGAISTEVWVNNANVDFPFERVPSAFIQQGCAAPHSVCRVDNSIMWLGSDERGAGVVWRADGYRPMRVSTHAIEREIQGYATISDAIGFAYQQQGHEFYLLTFPAADRTWAYDAAVAEWHERAYFDAENVQHRHRAACACQFAGQIIVGDHSTGFLYVLDLDEYTDNGAAIHRIRAAQHIATPDMAQQVFGELHVDMDPGVGLATGQGSDPQAMLRWSSDGGRTWSTEHWATIGRMGEYRTRVRWRRLGRARDRVFEVSITDPVRVAILGAAATVST